MRGANAAFVLTPVDVTQPDVNAVQHAVVDATAAAIRVAASPRHRVTASPNNITGADYLIDGGVVKTS